MKRFYAVILLFSISSHLYSADYFWVGNGGDWSDLSHWANLSGGAGNAYASLPTTADNVFFDGNSFSIGGETVDIDVDANAANLNFTGVTNSPVLDGAAARTITVNTTLTFVAGLTHNFAGDYVFSSTGAVTIISAAKVFNGDILFDGVGGTFTLSENLVVTGEIGLSDGTFDMAGFTVTTNSIDANRGTNVRTIDFGGSTVTIAGTGTVLDLRGNTTNLSVIPAGATINFTNTNDVIIETGNKTKTLPHLTFVNCTDDVDINTGDIEDNTERISFGNIVVAQDGARFLVDNNNDDSNIKTFQSITLPNDCRYIIGSGDGSGSFGGTNHSIVTGDFIVGNDGEGNIRGVFFEIGGDFDAGTDSDCDFARQIQFIGDFIVDGTATNHIIFNNNAEFSNDVIINGNARFRIDNDLNIAGDIIVANNITVNFNNAAIDANTVLSGTLMMGDESTIDLGGGIDGPFTLANISMGTETQLDINNNSSITSIGNLTLSSFNIVRFNTNGATNITGTLTSAGSCDFWIWLKSLTDGEQATVAFSSVQSSSFNLCQDINSSSFNLTNNNGINLSNNSGNITFPSITNGTTFFWVGGTFGNSNLGTSSTGVNDDWSNPDNWSSVSGNYSGTNSCIPGAQDDVIFDASSFSAGAGNIDFDLFIQACNSFTWTGVPSGCTMDAGLTNTGRELIILGNTSLDNNLDNQFEGLTTFTAIDGITRTIACNGSYFFGNIDFDFIGGNWSLSDNFDMNGEANADVVFRNGTVNANSFEWTIEDDWTVGDGTFTASTSTVIFDGPASQNSRQEVDPNGNSFYNFYVSRGTNGGGNNDVVRLNDVMTVNNDLFITRGALVDNGFQITGSLSGAMEINNAARIVLGRSNNSTLFPTNYFSANIDLNESGQTRYNSNVAQTISSVPVYGRLYLTNTSSNPNLVDKSLDGTVIINDLLLIDNFNHLIDAGFQITGGAGEEIQMDPNSQITLGAPGVATQFPFNFTTIDINTPSTVIYNSGLNQTVKSIDGAGDARYSNLVITNASGGGAPVKLLAGDIIVRGDLTINNNNELDVDAGNNSTIELQGDWINDGSFDAREGLVNLTGSAAQTMTSGGTEETFYDLTITNTDAGGVTIEDDISVSNLLTFSDGVIYEGSGTNELVTIEEGGTVAGASNASHVDGRVEKIGTIAFDFPVGKNDLYRPISIGIPTVAATGFIAEYFNVTPHPTFNINSLAVTIDHVSNFEYWILDRTVGAGDAAVTLSWNSASAVNGLADLIVARWDGTTWQNEGTNGSPIGNATAGTVTSAANVTSFSPFTLGSTSVNNPLPITLINFDATSNNGNVRLDWQTESEINNDYFTIERSENGVRWEEVATVDGAGNSNRALTYNTFDESPYKGTSYYRLLQTDFDGKYSYSNIVPVNFHNQKKLVAYPNPTNNQLTIRNYSGVYNEIKLYNSIGQNIFSNLKISKITKDELTVNFDNLPVGLYTLITNNGSLKIIKQ